MSDILERLCKYNPSDRTIDDQRQIAIDIRDAADEIAWLRTAKLRKRPVAFRVKDFADGWILFHSEEAANHESEAMGGALMQGLYVRNGT